MSFETEYIPFGTIFSRPCHFGPKCILLKSIIIAHVYYKENNNSTYINHEEIFDIYKLTIYFLIILYR